MSAALLRRQARRASLGAASGALRMRSTLVTLKRSKEDLAYAKNVVRKYQEERTKEEHAARQRVKAMARESQFACAAIVVCFF